MESNKQKQWVAVYTKARSECKVVSKLESLGLTCYFPQRQTIHQWSDRKKAIKTALIPSYVFVSIELCNYYRVYESEAVIKVVTFNNRVAIVRPSEIELLRLACGDLEVTVESDIIYRVGEQVEIIEGLFTGYSGIVVGKRECSKVAIRIQELGLSLVVTVPKIQVRLRQVV
jgi:transcription antitermination factor NusG